MILHSELLLKVVSLILISLLKKSVEGVSAIFYFTLLVILAITCSS